MKIIKRAKQGKIFLVFLSQFLLQSAIGLSVVLTSSSFVYLFNLRNKNERLKDCDPLLRDLLNAFVRKRYRLLQSVFTYKKWDIPGLFFFFFRLFNTVDSKQMFNINFADDWIRSADLWYWKRPLYQLSHTTAQVSII